MIYQLLRQAHHKEVSLKQTWRPGHFKTWKGAHEEDATKNRIRLRARCLYTTLKARDHIQSDFFLISMIRPLNEFPGSSKHNFMIIALSHSVKTVALRKDRHNNLIPN